MRTVLILLALAAGLFLFGKTAAGADRLEPITACDGRGNCWTVGYRVVSDGAGAELLVKAPAAVTAKPAPAAPITAAPAALGYQLMPTANGPSVAYPAAFSAPVALLHRHPLRTIAANVIHRAEHRVGAFRGRCRRCR